MKIKGSLFFGILLTLLMGAPLTYGEDNRIDKRFGVYLGVISDPLISLASLNVAYNATDYLRLTGGVGYLSLSSDTIISVGVGVKGLLPHLEFSPAIGLNISNSNLSSSSGTAYFVVNNNSTNNLFLVCSNFGFDYQAKDGFDIGLEISVPLINARGWLPGLNIGKFF